MRRISRTVLASLGAMLLLSGCSWLGTSYAILDREAEAGDELPSLTDAGEIDIDPATSRFVGERDGVGFWLGRTTNVGQVCILVYPNDTDWVIGCGSEGGEFGVSGRVPGVYSVVPDGAPIPDDATRLFDNVYVVGN